MPSESGFLTTFRAPGNLVAASIISLVAFSFALAIGNPGGSGPAIPIIAAVGVVGVVLLSRSYAGYLVMAASGYLLACIAVLPDRYLNAYDAILPLMLPPVVLGAVKRDAEWRDSRIEIGSRHDAIREATRRLAKAVGLFFGLAALSIGPMYFRVGPYPAMNSAFAIVRGFEGLLMFPLGLWWIRSQRRVELLANAVLAGGLLYVVTSLALRVFQSAQRAGIGWVVNQPESSTEDPNSAGLAMVFVMAMVLAGHMLRPRLVTYGLIIAALVGLVLSQSRSGMLAMAVFLLLNVRGARFRHLLLAVLFVVLAAVLAPEDFRVRVVKSVMLERGSFELFSFLTRVYGYAAHIKAFLDNWLFGVGYLGATYVCPNYNELKISLPAENYYLETAVGMGVIGLAVMTVCFVRLFRLGKAVRENAPPGTLGHSMAKLHGPLLIAIMTACMTGGNLVGLVTLSELAVWCVLMIRAGHEGLRADKELASEP